MLEISAENVITKLGKFVLVFLFFFFLRIDLQMLITKRINKNINYKLYFTLKVVKLIACFST